MTQAEWLGAASPAVLKRGPQFMETSSEQGGRICLPSPGIWPWVSLTNEYSGGGAMPISGPGAFRNWQRPLPVSEMFALGTQPLC